MIVYEYSIKNCGNRETLLESYSPMKMYIIAVIFVS